MELTRVSVSGSKKLTNGARKSTVQVDSSDDEEDIQVDKSRKGFSKHMNPWVELFIGYVICVFMLLSPAAVFCVLIKVPYYTVIPSSCNQESVRVQSQNIVAGVPSPDRNSGDSSTAQVSPPAVFFREYGIFDIATNSAYGMIFGREWNMYLDKGVCPDGQALDWTATPAASPTEAVTQPSVTSDMCITWGDSTTWTNIDKQLQYQNMAGNDMPISDMHSGGESFSIYEALFGDELEDATPRVPLEAGDLRNSQFKGSNPALLEQAETREDAMAKWLVKEHFHELDGEKLNMNVMIRKAEEDEVATTSICVVIVETVTFIALFCMSLVALGLLQGAELTSTPDAWGGFFVTCSVAVQTSTGHLLLLYQCISMALHLATVLVCELYYLSEYCAYCFHNLHVHPDEIAKRKLNAELTGGEVEKTTWDGPVFTTRLHIAKVRAIKATLSIIFGPGAKCKRQHTRRRATHKDQHPNKERSLSFARMEQDRRQLLGQPVPSDARM